MFDARRKVAEFNRAFRRPVNHQWTIPTIAERELLGKLLLEEVLEYCFKGLGLELHAKDMVGYAADNFELRHREGVKVDPIEVGDGLADVNVVIHFNAHWHGFNLDAATAHVHESNMSKLGLDGLPIINGESPGYREDEPGYDPTRPIGKILKGPNYWEPQAGLAQIVAQGSFPTSGIDPQIRFAVERARDQMQKYAQFIQKDAGLSLQGEAAQSDTELLEDAVLILSTME